MTGNTDPIAAPEGRIARETRESVEAAAAQARKAVLTDNGGALGKVSDLRDEADARDLARLDDDGGAIHVNAETGSDVLGDGSKERPFATLLAAQAAAEGGKAVSTNAFIPPQPDPGEGIPNPIPDPPK